MDAGRWHPADDLQHASNRLVSAVLVDEEFMDNAGGFLKCHHSCLRHITLQFLDARALSELRRIAERGKDSLHDGVLQVGKYPETSICCFSFAPEEWAASAINPLAGSVRHRDLQKGMGVPPNHPVIMDDS